MCTDPKRGVCASLEMAGGAFRLSPPFIFLLWKLKSVCCRCPMVWWLLAMRKKLSKSFPKRRMVLTVSSRFVPLLQSGMKLEAQTLWT